MKTPRTEAFMESLKGRCDTWEFFAQSVEDFARQLETELAAMTALADRLAEAIESAPYDEPLAEALAAYDNHKKKTP